MISQDTYRKHKAAMTRAENSGDPMKVLIAVRAAWLDFNAHGFPDFWPRWRNAWDNAMQRLDAEIDWF